MIKQEKLEEIWSNCLKYEIWQKKEEFLYLIQEVEKHLQTSIVIEIGTAVGGSSYGFSQICAEVITVDKDDRVKLELPTNIKRVRGLSYSPETRKEVQAILNNRKVDLIFLDATHYFENTRLDFENYAPFLRPGGIIALHDIVDSEKGRKENVWTKYLWDYFKMRYSNMCKFKEVIYPDITKEPEEEWAGIGIIYT